MLAIATKLGVHTVCVAHLMESKHFTFFWNVPGRMIWDKIPIDAVKGMGNQNCNDDGMHLK